MAEPSPAEQAEIMKALQSGSFRSKAPSSTLLHSSFTDPINELTTGGEGSKTNSRKIYCFRDGCGSVILQPNAAAYVESTESIIPNDPASPFPLSTTAPHGYWHVPDPYAFDNIGFSRPDTNSNLVVPAGLPGNDGKGEKKIKWLICAECDLGPVGWGYEGGKEAWVALERVRYGDK